MLQPLTKGIPNRCPDQGTCHHACGRECYRTLCCLPLAGIYPGDDWPADLDNRPREHPFWEGRAPQHANAKIMDVDTFLELYWDAPAPPLPHQLEFIRATLRQRNAIVFHGRGWGKTTVAQAISRMWDDV